MSEQTVFPRRGLVMLLLALLHLGCVFFSAFEVRLPNESLGGKVMALYGGYTGAGSAFGFFAPFVGTQLRMMLEVTNRDGQTIEEPFRMGTHNREIALRLSNAVALFWVEDEHLRRTLSASIAGKVLATHPDAQSVAVRVDVLKMPTMKAYREGNRPSWVLHYRAKYVARAKSGSKKEAGQ